MPGKTSPEAAPHLQHDLLADYLPWAEAIQMPAPPPKAPHCRDPDDTPFLQLAITAKADALVTGDADLLDLTPLPALMVLQPAQAGCYRTGAFPAKEPLINLSAGVTDLSARKLQVAGGRSTTARTGSVKAHQFIQQRRFGDRVLI